MERVDTLNVTNGIFTSYTMSGIKYILQYIQAHIMHNCLQSWHDLKCIEMNIKPIVLKIYFLITMSILYNQCNKSIETNY